MTGESGRDEEADCCCWMVELAVDVLRADCEEDDSLRSRAAPLAWTNLDAAGPGAVDVDKSVGEAMGGGMCAGKAEVDWDAPGFDADGSDLPLA